MGASKLFTSLVNWLDNPHIEVRVVPHEEVEELRSRCNALENEVSKATASYAEECQKSMRYMDLLRANNIPFR